MKAITIWVGAIALAALAASHAIAMYGESQMPEVASMMYPKNGKAEVQMVGRAYQAAVLESGATDFSTPLPDGTSERAKEAFRHEPLLPQALRFVALERDISGDLKGARALMRLVPAISKREQASNLWLILDYGRQKNLPKMLLYYDIVLRSSTTASTQILPQVAAQLPQDEILPPLADLLKKNPPWARAFWRASINTPASLPNATKLWLAVGNPEPEVTPLERSFVSRLVAEGRLSEAVAIRNASHRLPEGAARAVLFNENFSVNPSMPPLDWVLISDSSLDSWIDPARGLLLIESQAGERKLAVRQLFEAEPGQYQLSVTFARNSGSRDIEMQFRCATGRGRTFAPEAMVEDGVKLTGPVSIPGDDCRQIWIELYVTSPEAALVGVQEIAMLEL